MASGRAARLTVHVHSHHTPQMITLPTIHTHSASSADFRAIFGQVAIHTSCI
ncbi:hypothetical protein M404DRAFT_1000495 [Pisolithus tinctorius Marx 270]|uniref:Uncharacterized protein n=1 Tax=Pisolithus tinctorius Marx 270 TaxID=870435 RepID=A0A0C3NUY7_PISTI|nr:hypothetical protein M404DRAFT_1000495 [Pisolithus tinctorius Marx 270]